MAKAKRRGATRKITRKQALSYQRTVPNRRGVTAIAELNAPGAYDRRYRRAQRYLDGGQGMYTPAQRRAMKKMSAKRRAGFKKMLAKSPPIASIRPGAKTKKNPRRRKLKKNKRAPTAAEMKKFGRGFGRTFKKAKKKATPKKRAKAPIRTKTKRPIKAEFIARRLRAGRSPKQAANDWRISYGRHLGAKKGKKQRRTYGGKRALKARVGSKSKHTYMYRTRKGKVRHLPLYAELGFDSAYAYRKAKEDPKKAAALAKKVERIKAARRRVAGKTVRRIMRGKGMFAPNPGDSTLVTFKEWKEDMKKNKKKTSKKRKARKKTGGWTKAKRRAAAKKAARTRARHKAARSRAGKKAAATRKRHGTKKRVTKKRTTKKRVTRKRGKLTKAQRSAAAKKGWRKRKRGTSGAKRKTTGSKKRRRTARAKSMTITMRANKAFSYKYKKNIAVAYKESLKESLKIGAIVIVGYMTHRAGSKLLDEFALAKIGALQTSKWRGLLSSTLVALAGVPLVIKVMPQQAVPLAAGVAASFLHGALLTALGETKSAEVQKVAGYLSAYPDASGRAYSGLGSYYTFRPREIFNQGPMGEYYRVLPQQGMGLDYSQLTQAAAGMGAEVTQAAAGTGEYLIHGAEGIGDYEEVPMQAAAGIGGAPPDEGIMPNLYSAEQALNVAEAAAGLGDIPLRSTVNPLVVAKPIPDAPGASRAGILAGGDGIFGG